MREYKFRVYDKDRQKMYYLLENRRSFGTSEFDRAVDWEDVFADKHEELVIMQYTELKDKNGKEIYEGDIVEYYNNKYKVFFKEERGGFSPFANDGGCGCCCDLDYCSNSYCEVIRQHI